MVFGSPRRLNLQLLCSAETPARDTLNIWPPLPLLIYADEPETSGVDNVVAALECSDRVREISISISRSQSKQLWKGMRKPLPELTFLKLESNNEHEPVSILPDSLLGASAPRLRSLFLEYIPFPGLPKLLFSATNLVELTLSTIPPPGYISPESMVTGFSTLKRLEKLCLEFEFPQFHPDRENGRLPLPTRSVLPALTYFKFKGASKYLDELVARIDIPRLKTFSIIFFEPPSFESPHLVQFIRRTPYSKEFGKVHITCYFSDAVMVNLSSQTSNRRELNLAVLSTEPNLHITYLTLVCTSFLPALPTLEDLYINENELGLGHEDWEYYVEDHEWLELLRPFKQLKCCPSCRIFFLEGLLPSERVQEGIAQFVAARQLTRHPITVSFRDNIPTQDRYTDLFTL